MHSMSQGRERIKGDTMSYVHRGAFYKANLKRIG